MSTVVSVGPAAPEPLVRIAPVYAIVAVFYLGYAMMATLFMR